MLTARIYRYGTLTSGARCDGFGWRATDCRISKFCFQETGDSRSLSMDAVGTRRPASVLPTCLYLTAPSHLFNSTGTGNACSWGVQTERNWIRRRLLALEMALIFAFLILVSSAFVGLNLTLGKSRDWLPDWLLYESWPLIVLGSRVLLSLASFGMTLAGFLVLFERLPNRPMRLRQVFPSAFLTAILWQGARAAFTFLLSRFNYRHVYGSIGAMVSFMTWAYFSSAVMLYGTRISYSLYRTVEGPIPPTEAPPPTP